jgi:hypothetical protein
LSVGLDGILLVKNADDSAPGGQFFEIAGSTAAANLLASAPKPAHLSGFLGGDHGMVIASIGDFGAAGPYFIVGAPLDNSSGAFGTGTGNIAIVDGSGALVETVTGLGVLGSALFGEAVAGIGDINNDGYADVLIGSPGTPGQLGAAYVLFGSAINPSFLDMSTLASSAGFAIGGVAGANLGTDVSSAGDFNNNGQADFMVSNPGTGIVDVYMQGSIISAPLTINVGSTANTDIPVMDLGDVNGGGVSDIGILVHSAKSGGELAVFYGGAGHTAGQSLSLANADFTIAPTTGTLAAAGAVGDFNGDGKADIGVVITNGATADIYVVYGGGTLTGTLTTADLNNPNIAFHMVYNAPVPSALSGMTISGAGDMNGDGLGDLAIGLPGLDTNGGASSTDGAAVVVYGQTGGTAAYASGTTATAAGQSVVNGGTLSDGGFGNVSLSGGAGNDVINVSNDLFGKISGGAGIDTVNFLGGTLDFTALGSERVARIEQINMSGTGQGINLNMQNIFNLMDSSDTGNLVITASNSTDILTLHNATGTGSPNTAAALNTLLGSSSFNTDTGNLSLTDFHFGSHTLSIETALITATSVHVV